MAGAGGDGGAPAGANPRVRSEFQNTALWIGQLTTDEDGKASFELQLPTTPPPGAHGRARSLPRRRSARARASCW